MEISVDGDESLALASTELAMLRIEDSGRSPLSVTCGSGRSVGTVSISLIPLRVRSIEGVANDVAVTGWVAWLRTVETMLCAGLRIDDSEEKKAVSCDCVSTVGVGSSEVMTAIDDTSPIIETMEVKESACVADRIDVAPAARALEALEMALRRDDCAAPLSDITSEEWTDSILEMSAMTLEAAPFPGKGVGMTSANVEPMLSCPLMVLRAGGINVWPGTEMIGPNDEEGDPLSVATLGLLLLNSNEDTGDAAVGTGNVFSELSEIETGIPGSDDGS